MRHFPWLTDACGAVHAPYRPTRCCCRGGGLDAGIFWHFHDWLTLSGLEGCCSSSAAGSSLMAKLPHTRSVVAIRRLPSSSPPVSASRVRSPIPAPASPIFLVCTRAPLGRPLPLEPRARASGSPPRPDTNRQVGQSCKICDSETVHLSTASQTFFEWCAHHIFGERLGVDNIWDSVGV